MSQNPTWKTLLMSEPKLEALFEIAKKYKPRSPYFCANSLWLAHINKRSFKEVVEMLTKGDKKAYKIAAKAIYMALPDCRKCYCKTIGLRPKNSRMILIKQLFEKLVETSEWCNRHPSKAEQMYQKTQPLIKRLVELGVDKLVAEAALYISAVVDDHFLSQFEETDS